MKLWIARDYDGALCIYQSKPFLDPYDAWDSDYNYLSIDKKKFPEVTFENSPQEVEIKLVK